MTNCIQNGNSMTVNIPKEIAEEFNNHFTFIAKNIENKLIKAVCDFSKFLNNLNKDSFFISPTNKEELTSIIKTSTGPTIIPIKFLRLFQNTLNEPIALLSNLPFFNWYFFYKSRDSKCYVTFQKR